MRQGLGPIPGFVLVVLADAANEKNTCWPRIATLAARVGVSKRTVQRALKLLVKRELIAIEQRYRSDGSCSLNLYRLRLEGGDRLSPLPDSTVTPCRPLCQGGSDTCVTPLTTRRTEKEPPPLTVKPGTEPERPKRCGGNSYNLHYPRDLLSPERTRAKTMMGALDPPLAQQVLDEWAGIIHAGSIRASPLGCLRALIRRAKEGTFTPERAMHVAEARKAKQCVAVPAMALPEPDPLSQV